MFYLYGSISLLFLFLAMMLLRSDLRKQGLLSGLFFIIYGPISELIFFRDYWSPMPVLPQLYFMGHYFLSEDLLYAFSIVGIMSSVYDLFFKKRIKNDMYPKRYLLATVLSLFSLIIFIFLALRTQINSIFISSGVAIFSASIILLIRKDLRRTALLSSTICGVGASLFYFIIFQIPGATDFLIQVWKLPIDQAAVWIFGKPIPLTELLWAFAIPLFFSVIFKFAVGSGYIVNTN